MAKKANNKKAAGKKGAGKATPKKANGDLAALSSEELFKLAEAKKQEEESRAVEAKQEKVAALKTEKRDLQNRLNAIEKEIAALSGKKSAASKTAKTSAAPGRRALRGNTKKIYDCIAGSAEPVAVADIVGALSLTGSQKNSLPAALTSLKKRGYIASAGRGKYSAA